MNTPLHSSRTNAASAATVIALTISALLVFHAGAANKTWDGGGTDNNWLTGGNWDANTAPAAAGDSLFFTGTTRIVNSNNLVTAVNGLTFSTPAGAFSLNGNSISLDGGITNNQALLTETINLPLVLSGDRNVAVANGAALTIGGAVSGSFGLSKSGAGLLTLGTANTFAGPVTILGGIVSVGADNNLGTAPGVATPGNIVLNGGGLRSTATLTLSANRGIALGPTSGSGSGRIDVNNGLTLTYSGVLANNGGTGGLTKGGPGTLVISSANSYTGPTSNRVGNLTLDFTQGGSPLNNVISSSSTLSIGGETTGVGIVNNIQLLMSGKASVSNTQSFSSTFFDTGHSTVRANSGASGGAANMFLGALDHLPGGAVTFTPPSLNAGLGDINTSSTNVNGILGGWATISSSAQVVNGIPVATNWATVDANGNIFPYTNFVVYSSGTIRSLVSASDNLIFLTSGGPGSSVRVDVDHTPETGTTTDLNTLTINPPNPASTVNRFGINIGSNNVLRLGKYGGIFLANVPSVADQSYELGNGTDPSNNPGANAGQNVGTLTAGGAPNTDGELVFTVDSTSQTANGSIYCEVAITDNGSGKVSVIKTGPGPMKFRGHNSFSGNMYILQGRIQMAGAELPNPDSEGANPDAFGRGDIYVLPGGQAFPSGAGGNTLMPAITNNWFLAGNGVSDNVGSIRFPNAGIFSNAVMTLIGDTRLGGGGFATGVGGRVYNKITGPFNLDFGATGNSGGGANGAILYNQLNDWTGDTSIVGRTGSAGNSRLLLGTNDVIPDGFGKGNLVLGNTGNNNNSECRLDLNGFNETVNGLVSFVGNEAIQFIENRAASTTSTLTVGNNDSSSTFGGTILDGGGITAVTKIGGGALTLTGNNTYTGDTTVNGGTLALSGTGALASPEIRVNTNATLNLAGLSDFTAASARLNGGTLFANAANVNLSSLTLTNGQLTLVPDTGSFNIISPGLTTGGLTNRINITTVSGVSGYPSVFPLIDNTVSVGGVGNNFGLGEVPSINTIGYVSNDVANSRIVLVLLDGPKPLTWTGTNDTNPTFWDNLTTTNWLAFKGQFNEAPVAFGGGDSVTFDDTGATNNISLVGSVSPGGITVNNSTLNYTFSGGGISGLGGLLKAGSATLTLVNTGLTDFRGGVIVSAGTLTFASDNAIAGGTVIASGATANVGANGNSGNLPAGIVTDDGSLVFNRGSTAYTVANKIGGTGTITKNDTAILTLSGPNSTLTGAVVVASGTLKAASATALGTVDGSTTVNSGATLDLNGQTLTTEQFIVSGSGVTNGGAIINNGAANQDATGFIALSNNATFGGTARWDIRGGAATLTTGGNAYNLTKVGSGQFSLVGVTVDTALGNITVSNGIFSAETTTTSLGNPASTLTVAPGGTLQFFNTDPTVWDKVFVLNGNTLTNTLNNASGVNTVGSAITINSNVVMNIGGTSLTLNGAVGGAGTLRKTGTGILNLNANNTYTGGTTNTAGTLIINGLNSGGGTLTNFAGSTIGGRGTNTGPVLAGTNVTFLPGGANMAGTFGCGNLALNSSVLTFDLGTNDFNNAFPVNDLIYVTGNLTLAGMTTNRFTAGPVGSVTNGQIITLIHYTGTRTGSTNNLTLVPPQGYGLVFLDPATTANEIQIKAITVPANITWNGLAPGAPTAWDVGNTTNWIELNAGLSDFLNFDGVTFTDAGNTNLVTLTTNVQPASITMNNASKDYTFAGPGKITGITKLDVSGGGKLTLANGTNANDFAGPINITYGTLQVGDGGTNGTLGAGAVTNNNNLVFNRSNNLTVANNIAGGGGGSTITNLGTGILTLSGNNTFEGPIYVASGTLRAGSGNALGSSLGGTFVANGATLDTGGQTINLDQISVSGAGVGGLGAIVNNVTDAANGLGNVLLEGDTVFGGTNRWDIRLGAATLDTLGSIPCNIIKKGPNQVSLVGVSVFGSIKNIDVQQGTFSVETTTSSLGDAASSFTLAAGATLQWFNVSSPMDKIFTLTGNGSNNTVNCSSGTGSTVVGPTTIIGPCIFNVTGANALTMGGYVMGSGSLTKTTSGLLTFSGTNIYTGNTTISGGTVFWTGYASNNVTPVITIGAGATLDVLGLSDGPTLALSSGQTLMGNGLLNGSLVALPGSTVSPGTSIGRLTVTNDITLQGTTIMEINRTAFTNDRLRSVLGGITYGGSLIVTNVGGTLVGGESFKLFDSGTASYLGSFAPPQLPQLGPGLSWNTSALGSSGTISVSGTLVPPSISGATNSGANLVFSGSGGTPNGQYVVLAGTNAAQSRTNWTRLATNQFDGSGNFTVTAPIDPNFTNRFYMLLLP